MSATAEWTQTSRHTIEVKNVGSETLIITSPTFNQEVGLPSGSTVIVPVDSTIRVMVRDEGDDSDE